ncbi:hypothetical protein WT14_26905 [Burkholderia stagnalis]|nr:hypothetical protein WT07_02960 [Burkholderia stagnalis]KVN56491.1 hypothetical protein WT14_26905 [Burkholderia stagnalis]KWD93099.1 hypothetical protein WT47_32515 [Burkholderia stagnalis]KWE22242.1 hypothetical protein WT48_06535 [Burkholderia stagnalis]KWO86604.1 hypothetical protein WU00_26985 [Burkholderia stagnalis]
MHAVFREFAAATYAVVRENVATSKSRTEVSADDRRDATRWRALLNDGEPEVYVERTERRAIPVPPTAEPYSQKYVGETRPVSEMWVKRYAVFSWRARKHEQRTFTEAVDAIHVGGSSHCATG